ncbi:MAG: O-methyltransferase [Nitrospira sp.]|nr:O-methyltransferase [Nitrospira sp.]
MNIVDPEIESYINHLLPSQDDILKEMEQEGEKRRFPIVGPQVGRLLYQMARLTRAARIFEMGSGYGYSAYWFLKGMPANSRIILTDDSRENLDQARDYLKKAGLLDRVTLEYGDALDLIEKYPGPFDIIFNDIDKERYPEAFKKALPRIRSGGLLISDNVLWFGRVLTDSRDPDVEGIRTYNRLITQTKGLFTEIIPIRDGVSISIKD